jgi:hypothetical protein
MERRIEEPVDGISPEFRSLFSASGPPPQVTLAEYESKQRAKNTEGGEALLFASAKPRNSISKRDGFTEKLKFG